MALLKIFQVIATDEVIRSKDETKAAGWYTKEQLQDLGNKTEKYINKEITEEEWQQNFGLEPVMYEWFKEIPII